MEASFQNCNYLRTYERTNGGGEGVRLVSCVFGRGLLWCLRCPHPETGMSLFETVESVSAVELLILRGGMSRASIHPSIS